MGQIKVVGPGQSIWTVSLEACVTYCDASDECDAVNYHSPTHKCRLFTPCTHVYTTYASLDYYFYSKRPQILDHGYVFDKDRDTCVKLMETDSDMSQGDIVCTRQNGRLLSLTGPSSQELGVKLMISARQRPQYVWTGGGDPWGWKSDFTRSDYIPSNQQPGLDPNPLCSVLEITGHWHRVPCNHGHYMSLCEVPAFYTLFKHGSLPTHFPFNDPLPPSISFPTVSFPSYDAITPPTFPGHYPPTFIPSPPSYFPGDTPSQPPAQFPPSNYPYGGFTPPSFPPPNYPPFPSPSFPTFPPGSYSPYGPRFPSGYPGVPSPSPQYPPPQPPSTSPPFSTAPTPPFPPPSYPTYGSPIPPTTPPTPYPTYATPPPSTVPSTVPPYPPSISPPSHPSPLTPPPTSPATYPSYGQPGPGTFPSPSVPYPTPPYPPQTPPPFPPPTQAPYPQTSPPTFPSYPTSRPHIYYTLPPVPPKEAPRGSFYPSPPQGQPPFRPSYSKPFPLPDHRTPQPPIYYHPLQPQYPQNRPSDPRHQPPPVPQRPPDDCNCHVTSPPLVVSTFPPAIDPYFPPLLIYHPGYQPQPPGSYGQPQPPGNYGQPQPPGSYGQPQPPGSYGQPQPPGSLPTPPYKGYVPPAAHPTNIPYRPATDFHDKPPFQGRTYIVKGVQAYEIPTLHKHHGWDKEYRGWERDYNINGRSVDNANHTGVGNTVEAGLRNASDTGNTAPIQTKNHNEAKFVYSQNYVSDTHNPTHTHNPAHVDKDVNGGTIKFHGNPNNSTIQNTTISKNSTYSANIEYTKNVKSPNRVTIEIQRGGIVSKILPGENSGKFNNSTAMITPVV
ncbi:hypothetical protein M8J77_016587 [Diaphorina citri]|nr:hypothetical protein M8J77_016587 [Diaphorina citri]